MSAGVGYTPYHPRWYRRRVSVWWWMESRSYTGFVLREISSVAVAFALDIAEGTVTRARIGLGGVAATPIRATATEQALEGRPWDEETVERAAQVLAAEGTPIDDMRASATYRRAMLGNALRKLAAS